MIYIHSTAEIGKNVKIGANTKIWNLAQIREGAVIGKNCIISKNVYIDHHIKVGDNVKIQNNASIYFKTIIENGVFVGPNVIFTNDKIPRAVNPSGRLKDNWENGKIIVKEGASIGANSTIMTNITIGKWAMIGAGSIVNKSIPDYGLVVGSPARIIGFVCRCGLGLIKINKSVYKCNNCRKNINKILDDHV